MNIKELVYNWDSTVALIISVFISTVFFLLGNIKKLTRRKKQWNKLSVIFLIICIILSITLHAFVEHVQRECTYVPNFRMGAPLSDVRAKLVNSGLEYNIDDIEFDEIAQTHRENGEDVSSLYYRVTRTDPEPGTFTCKGKEVKLWVTWEDGLSHIAIEETNISDFIYEDYYEDIDSDLLLPFNTNSFSLLISKAVLKINAEGQDERILGIYSDTESSVKISLIDFDSGEIIEEKKASIGDKISFTNLPDGTYYYTVKCTGYKTYIPETPFRICWDSSHERDEFQWAISLESVDNVYSNTFSVQLVDAKGGPMADANISVQGIDNNYPYPDQIDSLPLVSNKDGYLTLWANTNGIDHYGVAKFQLLDGCSLQLIDEDGEVVTVKSNDSSVCVIDITDFTSFVSLASVNNAEQTIEKIHVTQSYDYVESILGKPYANNSFEFLANENSEESVVVGHRAVFGSEYYTIITYFDDDETLFGYFLISQNPLFNPKQCFGLEVFGKEISSYPDESIPCYMPAISGSLSTRPDGSSHFMKYYYHHLHTNGCLLGYGFSSFDCESESNQVLPFKPHGDLDNLILHTDEGLVQGINYSEYQSAFEEADKLISNTFSIFVFDGKIDILDLLAQETNQKLIFTELEMERLTK